DDAIGVNCTGPAEIPTEYTEVLHAFSMGPTEGVNLAAASTWEPQRGAGLSYDISVIVDCIRDDAGGSSEDPKVDHLCARGPNESMGLDELAGRPGGVLSHASHRSGRH